MPSGTRYNEFVILTSDDVSTIARLDLDLGLQHSEIH